MKLQAELNRIRNAQSNIYNNITRKDIIRQAVDLKEAMAVQSGALSTWTPPESTGRSPLDTLVVRRPESEGFIDWNSPNNLPLDPESFDMLLEDAIACLKTKDRLYFTDRVVGADPSYALPVRTITDRALTCLFTKNMFRRVPENIKSSVLADKEFTLIVLPYDKLDRVKYNGRLRNLPTGLTSDMVIAMDFVRKAGLVYGSAYCGSAKKLMFTVMNYYLPFENILPLHCSANEGKNGDVTLFLGLSGTGKTTLSADPSRALIGDDEHGWSENGIANFEYGCYAKLINLDPQKEPEIYKAVFHKREYLDHGAIIENCMTYPDGRVDLNDDRLTQNSRVSYPLSFLSNIKESARGGHPKTIIFLTADANGVLPPVSRLNPEQAMLWFLMGYTSKLAGTETGIVSPVSTFSRFFGQPFMPKKPGYYSDLLGMKMKQHNTRVFLINTGWSGGPYGEGKRIDILVTRAMIDAAIEGKLDDVEYLENKMFHVSVPKQCPGVPADILMPENTWKNKDAFAERAKKLAAEFSGNFDKSYGNAGFDHSIISQCPGK
ncbi:MAG: phosphoenolpyruvate carboxykinase (ATP) [Desulfobacterales bacterium]|jgi:phosphoenolpyruvate carboxykinase (ATP)|nr:phosphoenolpyruvate carboxykinase (ATP) [Desulfobacterales bacterium]